MNETKSLNDRAKEALVNAMEGFLSEPMAVAELGKAFASVVTAEATASQLSEAVSALKEL